MAGDADGGHLTVLHFLSIRGLIVFLTVMPKIVCIAIFVVIIVGKSGIQSGFEGFEVHGIGVKDILIFNLGMIPRLGNMYLISVGFSILSALTLAQDISRRIVADAVRVAIIGVVELLDTTTTPSCMTLRVLQSCLSLSGGRIEIRIPCVYSVPMITIKNGIIISRRIVITQVFTSSVRTIDVPPLGIILSHAFTGIISNP